MQLVGVNYEQIDSKNVYHSRWFGNHFVPTGAFCFNSSNQFSTTLICVGALPACSVGLSSDRTDYCN